MRGLRSRTGRASASSLRRGAIGLLLAVVFAPLFGAGTAYAESYQFWGYYNWSKDSWELAQTGPADVTPKDGDVDGWRFAIGMDEPRPPRADGDFDAICGQTEPESGRKRVAVVLDYGIAKEAPKADEAPQPRGECAVVPAQASSEQVLSQVAEVRAEQGLTCGVDGYPSTGCGDAAEPADVTLPEPKVQLQLPDADSGSGERSGRTGDSEQPGDSGTGSGESDESEQASEQQQDGGGVGVWAVVAIVAIVLIAGGALFAKLRARDKAA